jgi:hypothetical protein
MPKTSNAHSATASDDVIPRHPGGGVEKSRKLAKIQSKKQRAKQVIREYDDSDSESDAGEVNQGAFYKKLYEAKCEQHSLAMRHIAAMESENTLMIKHVSTSSSSQGTTSNGPVEPLVKGKGKKTKLQRENAPPRPRTALNLLQSAFGPGLRDAKLWHGGAGGAMSVINAQWTKMNDQAKAVLEALVAIDKETIKQSGKKADLADAMAEALKHEELAPHYEAALGIAQENVSVGQETFVHRSAMVAHEEKTAAYEEAKKQTDEWPRDEALALAAKTAKELVDKSAKTLAKAKADLDTKHTLETRATEADAEDRPAGADPMDSDEE